MMNVRRSAAVGLLVLASCAPGLKVRRVDANTAIAGRRWFVYSLPRAVISIDVPLVRKEVTPGKCAKISSDAIAKKLKSLGVVPVTDPSTKLSVGEISLTQRLEPDPEQIFGVQLTSSVLDSSKFAIEMSEDGILTSGSLESSNKLVDTTVKTLSTVATIAAGALGFAGIAPPTEHCLNSLQRLEELRTKRETLVGGVSGAVNGTPKDTLELMLSELRALEAGYAAQFEGEETLTTTTVHCEITPPTNTSPSPAFEVKLLSLTDSTVASADAGCTVAPVFLKPAEKTTRDITLKLAGDASVARAASKLEPTGRSESGWYFRVPVRALARVAAGTPDAMTEKQRALFYVPQFGSVVSLPGDLDIKTASLSMNAKFGSAGGLVSMGQATTAPDTAALAEAVGSAGKTTLDALKTRKDAREKAEVEQLEQEKKRLELLRDIEKLKAGQSFEE